MSVVTHKGLILVDHKGIGNAEQGKRLTDGMRQAIPVARRHGGRVGIYHDVSELESANEDYVKAFAGLAKELGRDNMVYVATIPKAWVRVLAKTASVLGGIETHFYKTEKESLTYLTQAGFELPAVMDQAFRHSA